MISILAGRSDSFLKECAISDRHIWQTSPLSPRFVYHQPRNVTSPSTMYGSLLLPCCGCAVEDRHPEEQWLPIGHTCRSYPRRLQEIGTRHRQWQWFGLHWVIGGLGWWLMFVVPQLFLYGRQSACENFCKAGFVDYEKENWQFHDNECALDRTRSHRAIPRNRLLKILFNARQPSLRTTWAEHGGRLLRNFKSQGLNLLNVPALLEGFSNFLFAHSPWSFRSWFLIGEAEDVQQSLRINHSRQVRARMPVVSSSLKVWNSPQSIPRCRTSYPHFSNSRALPTRKLALIPRSSLAFAVARSMATGT